MASLSILKVAGKKLSVNSSVDPGCVGFITLCILGHFAILICDRGEPFSKKAIKESRLQSICILPTSELFNLICEIRTGTISKKEAQERILNT